MKMLQVNFSLTLTHLKAVPRFCVSAKVQTQLSQVPWGAKSKSLLSVQLNINFRIWTLKIFSMYYQTYFQSTSKIEMLIFNMFSVIVLL